jgi:radical SAM superfamily enzyme YgiQ (UPF0313 family)
LTDRAAAVDIIAQLGGKLLKVDKPQRYTGGEYGAYCRKDAYLRTLIAFPDLYEIGMGNQALKIIYNRMNNIQDISCDRAFAAAPDFEKLLRENNIPLYGLDTGASLGSFDLLMFTIGYELGLNGVLTMLDVSGIPMRCEERDFSHPVIIAGGPAVSNPLPFSPFIDAFWIGEAEAGFFELASLLARMKKRGEGRAALFDKIASHPNVWVRGKKKALRAIASGFSDSKTEDENAAVFPVPCMKIVHNHGAVEIMRGCPNGCRFCHAGFWYRPARQKRQDLIVSQVRQMVEKGGWREISLSSLSSGDYAGVGDLVENLNNLFRDRHISFQMPSLKVTGFSLDLLEKISVTRKSGLTFAVETPRDIWQMAINKEVTRGNVTAILQEAKRRGWKSAKFYFMIGLPVKEIIVNEQLSMNSDIEDISDISEVYSEEEEIVSFITDVGRRTRMHFNINIGIFVPKPHTPYQWAAQTDGSLAEEKLNYIRSKLKPMGHKVSVSDILTSRIEGIMSRGDERAGYLCEQAWRNGNRLDAWSEYIDKEVWKRVIEENRNVVELILSGKNTPWQPIDSCVESEYLKQELERSNSAQRTSSCREKCSLCGVCNKHIKTTCEKENNTVSDIQLNSAEKNIYVNVSPQQDNNEAIDKGVPSVYRMLFGFSKKGRAVFHGHLSLIEIFSMSFTRANLPVIYTGGFNPIVKMEFASPLSTGISACMELAAVDFYSDINSGDFISILNTCLPEGINLEKAGCFKILSGMKKHSLASLFWGSCYNSSENEKDYVNFNNDKVYRKTRLESDCSSVFDLCRIEVLAKNIADNSVWASYFDVYKYLYGNNL